jgi:hypothetical protein
MTVSRNLLLAFAKAVEKTCDGYFYSPMLHGEAAQVGRDEAEWTIDCRVDARAICEEILRAYEAEKGGLE